MKYLVIIGLLFSTAYGQTGTVTTQSPIMDSSNIEQDSGFVDIRKGLQWTYQKVKVIENQVRQIVAPVSSGSVTQLTNKATAVTLNTIKGQITMAASALAAGAEVSFVVNNNQIGAFDLILVNIQSVGTVGSYIPAVTAKTNGSCTITLSNVGTASLSQAVVLNFLVFKQ